MLFDVLQTSCIRVCEWTRAVVFVGYLCLGFMFLIDAFGNASVSESRHRVALFELLWRFPGCVVFVLVCNHHTDERCNGSHPFRIDFGWFHSVPG